MGEDNSLNVAINADGSGDVEWQDLLKSERESQEELVVKKQIRTHRRKLVRNALGSLSERERLVLFERRLKDAPTTLQVLSNCLGISRERVRQIEVKAFEKLSKAVQNAALNPGLVSTIWYSAGSISLYVLGAATNFTEFILYEIDSLGGYMHNRLWASYN